MVCSFPHRGYPAAVMRATVLLAALEGISRTDDFCLSSDGRARSRVLLQEAAIHRIAARRSNSCAVRIPRPPFDSATEEQAPADPSTVWAYGGAGLRCSPPSGERAKSRSDGARATAEAAQRPPRVRVIVIRECPLVSLDCPSPELWCCPVCATVLLRRRPCPRCPRCGCLEDGE